MKRGDTFFIKEKILLKKKMIHGLIYSPNQLGHTSNRLGTTNNRLFMPNMKNLDKESLLRHFHNQLYNRFCVI